MITQKTQLILNCSHQIYVFVSFASRTGNGGAIGSMSSFPLKLITLANFLHPCNGLVTNAIKCVTVMK